MTFPDFLHAYRTGALDKDAAWRGYAIEAHMASLRTQSMNRLVVSTLKRLGLAYAGELAIPEFQARYGIPTPDAARSILVAWWFWAGIDAGRAMGVPRRAHPTGLSEIAALAPTLPQPDPL